MKVKIKELMDNLGLSTIPELYDYLNTRGAGVSQRTLYKWLQGEPFQSEKLAQVAKAAKVSGTWLIEE